MIPSQQGIEQLGIQIIKPHVKAFYNRYNNSYDSRLGSRYINNTSCPLCEKYLKWNSCTTCPMDLAFGTQDGNMDNSGCKVWIRKMWGSITFGDFPHAIIRQGPINRQLERMHRWLCKAFNLKPI